MGIHFANGGLVGDGALDATHRSAAVRAEGWKLQLVGVEYIVIADDWNAHHQTPPVLMGQLFNYSGAPNRFGIPASTNCTSGPGRTTRRRVRRLEPARVVRGIGDATMSDAQHQRVHQTRRAGFGETCGPPKLFPPLSTPPPSTSPLQYEQRYAILELIKRSMLQCRALLDR
jgi:hypothetical protein